MELSSDFKFEDVDGVLTPVAMHRDTLETLTCTPGSSSEVFLEIEDHATMR